MLSPRIFLKLYAEPNAVPPHAKVLEAWHGWIKNGSLSASGASEVLVDVVDYGHVHHGPAVLLVGHQADYALDESEGRPGLSYTRKRAADAPGARLADSMARLLRAAKLLEADPLTTGLRFGTGEILLRVLDRLNAPNTRATWDADRDEIVHVMTEALGKGTEVVYVEGDPREPFTVRARSRANRPLSDVLDSLTSLVARAGNT